MRSALTPPRADDSWPVRIRRALSLNRLNILFAVTIATVITLALWWARFLKDSVELRHQLALDTLRVQVAAVAEKLGSAEAIPPVGPLPGSDTLEIAVAPAHAPKQEPAAGAGPTGDATSGQGLTAPLLPNHPGFVLTPRHELLSLIDAQYRARRGMVYGEGGTLLFLVAFSLFLFYRLAARERRLRAENDAFLSIVTHELKTPVAGVKAVLQSLELGRVPAERAPTLLRMGLAELDRLDHLIENVLTRNRLRQGRQELRVAPIDVAARVRELVDKRLLVRAAAGTDPHAAGVGDGAPVTALADAEALRIIIDNLLDNAAKYGAPGEFPTVRVARGQSSAGEPVVRIDVADRGVGFEPAVAEKLFEPFFRDETVAPTRRGAGLGLAIARNLARRMGGELTAFSEGPGQGSRFTLQLRAAD